MPGQSAAVAAVLFMTCYQLRRVKCGTEIALTGGRTAAGIVRIGDTVRGPISARSDFVHGILRHLEAKGFQGALRFLGLDEKGREVLTFVPGAVPSELGAFTDDQITAAAELLGSLHDATTDRELRCAQGKPFGKTSPSESSSSVSLRIGEDVGDFGRNYSQLSV